MLIDIFFLKKFLVTKTSLKKTLVTDGQRVNER